MWSPGRERGQHAMPPPYICRTWNVPSGPIGSQDGRELLPWAAALGQPGRLGRSPSSRRSRSCGPPNTSRRWPRAPTTGVRRPWRSRSPTPSGRCRRASGRGVHRSRSSAQALNGDGADQYRRSAVRPTLPAWWASFTVKGCEHAEHPAGSHEERGPAPSCHQTSGRRHGSVSGGVDRIRCAKDTGLRRLTYREFAINQAWCRQQRSRRPDRRATPRPGRCPRAEPKRLRCRLLHTAARLTHGQRRRWLRISATWPWADRITAATDPADYLHSDSPEPKVSSLSP